MNASQSSPRGEPDIINSTTSTTPKSSGFWQQSLDGIALVLAGTCAIHCLLLPIFVVFFPILSNNLAMDHRFHVWMLAAVIPTTAIAVFLGCRKHKDKWVISLSALGLCLLTIGVLLEYAGHTQTSSGHNHSHFDETLSFSIKNWISVIGGFFMAAAHIRNFKNCNSENSNCHCEH